MRIHITDRYLWFPVDNGKPEVKLHLLRDGGKFQEIDIHLGGTDCEFYASMDVSAHLDRDIDINGTVDEAALRQIFCYHDPVQHVYPFRPQIHYAAKTGWINDPNGLIYADGVYHLYHQWNPYGTEWGNMHWGHAVSRDLLHWEHRPMAMEPDEYGTAYSGCAWQDHDNVAGYGKDALLFFYTASGGCNQWSIDAGNEHVQRLAISTDGGDTLRKVGTLIGHIAGGNRDPKVFWHEHSGAYIMALFLDDYDFAVFRSTDLLDWKESQRFTAPDGMRECPDLFELEVVGGNRRKWVFWSADGYYLVGDFDGYRFTPESPMRCAYRTGLPYAAQTYAGIAGRTVSVTWHRLENSRGHYRGMMSIPVELSLIERDGEYLMRFVPVRELGACLSRRVLLENCVGDVLYRPLDGKPILLALRWNEQASGKTEITVGQTTIRADFGDATLTMTGPCDTQTNAMAIDPTRAFDLSVVIDQEVIEFYGDEGTLYGAVETEENVLAEHVCIRSDVMITSVALSV